MNLIKCIFLAAAKIVKFWKQCKKTTLFYNNLVNSQLFTIFARPNENVACFLSTTHLCIKDGNYTQKNHHIIN